MPAHPEALTVPMQEAARLLGALNYNYAQAAIELGVHRATVLRWASREDFHMLRSEWEQRRLDELEKELTTAMRKVLVFWSSMFDQPDDKLASDGRIAIVTPIVAGWLKEAFAIGTTYDPPPRSPQPSVVQQFVLSAQAAHAEREV